MVAELGALPRDPPAHARESVHDTRAISAHASTGRVPGIPGSAWQIAAAMPAVSQRSPETGPIRRLSPTP